MRIKIFKPTFFKDKRGDYWTTWKKDYFNGRKFNHDKFSISRKNVIRGFHVDLKSWRMVSCILGKIILYVINFDKKSKNFLKKKKIILDDKNKKIVLIPPKFASAHLCISKKCVFHYKFSYKGSYSDVEDQIAFKWNDPRLKIKWPVKSPILSYRDKNSKQIKDLYLS
tara:strand:+ start:976 stop:1479 length:504 start_codon:yes stop_codon:yes gene_type:complete